MPMSTSTFTTAERRKKAVTYGKSGRYTATKLFDDAPSPERPRKQAGAVFATIQKSDTSRGIRSTLSNNRAMSAAPVDVFEVPSEDEPTPRAPAPAPRKKKTPVMTQDVGVFDFPTSEDERGETARKFEKSVPVRKVEAARPPVPASKRKVQEKQRVVPPSSEDPLAAPLPETRRRAKSPQVLVQRASVEQSQPAKRTTRSRATTPAPLVAVSNKKKAKDATISSKKPKLTSGIKSPALDIFDVPTSDEDAPAKTPMRPRPVPSSRIKVLPAPRVPNAPLSPSPSEESDVSTKSHKRKRDASVCSSTRAKMTSGPDREMEVSVPLRNRKHHKKENSVSPGHDTVEVPPLVPHIAGIPEEVVIMDKPRRTKQRASAAPHRALISKGKSSPAKLHTMLADRSRPRQKPTPAAPILPEPSDENETMYDPDDTETPQIPKKMAVPGSMTPRQRDMFSNLLDDSSDPSTPMPNVSALKLTDRKPGSALASLLRSSSDIPQSAHTRKSRLIDMLKQATSSSDEDSESDEETEEEIVKIPNVSAPPRTAIKGRLSAQDNSQDTTDAMEVDSETLGNSQSSQTAVNLRTGGRVTYAKQRSYLEEQGDNMEDILDMVFNDDIGLDSQRQCSLSEDDEDMGMHGIHDLRNTGQQQKFNQEVDFAIDDIAGHGGLNASQRRSAMIDFATSLADKYYAGQLLESSLTSRLLRSISSSGEIIFDFAAAVAILFILEKRPGAAILEEIRESTIMATLDKLLISKFAALDIHRIAKDRKTNMSLKAREMVAEFRSLILNSGVWSPENLEKVSPQLLAIKVLELLVVSLRQAGNAEVLADETMITRIVEAASGPCQRMKAGNASAQDHLLLESSLSTLESLSVTKERQATWSNELLARLADMMPAVFQITNSASPIKLAIRLCINLTNDKPKACQLFSHASFITPLIRSINQNFKLLVSEGDAGRRTEINEDLIFSLGAMINLAECSEQARASAIQDGDEVVDELVQIFLEGSERADQAASMEESQFIVPIGYLSILLGNLCLEHRVRKMVLLKLPGGKIDMLVQKMREFILYNQRVDRLTGDFRGKEGEQTHKNFTERLGLVVGRLEKAGA
ncbi:hypothetical protein CC80DRAFT_478182 [Byssothecium circinans]|uniref:Wings apart-like protein C-terminal domain-containing protein n=1 Tax=Byssothecium circinans TaxID=147558 RepID=A0A6A5TW56_9PLEO|nr:hypothetical protein CC80DRAFT_478182 [Byssothecium circinans]